MVKRIKLPKTAQKRLHLETSISDVNNELIDNGEILKPKRKYNTRSKQKLV